MSKTIEDVLTQHVPVLEKLRQSLVAYFHLCVDQSKTKTYTRRPPFALRLPHGDYVFVIKPTICQMNKVVTLADGLHIESLRVLDDRHSSSVLDVLVFPDSIRKTGWMCDYSLSLDAAENLVELTKYFLLFPDEVFARSKDRCCCCGKSLTDEISRCRGIGPECLKDVTTHWRHWLVEEHQEQQPVRIWRSIFDE